APMRRVLMRAGRGRACRRCERHVTACARGRLCCHPGACSCGAAGAAVVGRAPTAGGYDPLAGGWGDAAPAIDPPVVDSAGASTVLPDGRVLVGAHGVDPTRPFWSRTAIYTSSTNLWSAASYSAGGTPRTWVVGVGARVTVVDDGDVLRDGIVL